VAAQESKDSLNENQVHILSILAETKNLNDVYQIKYGKNLSTKEIFSV